MKSQSILGVLAGSLYRLYSATWRYRVTFSGNSTPVNFHTKTPKQSCVCAHWHGDELALIGLAGKSKILTLSSQSKDGEIMTAALKTMGFSVVRGSSSRGGMRGLVVMIRKIRNQHFFVSFAMDGSKGPRHQAKAGVHFFALKTNVPIYQCLVRCEQKWIFEKSWNKAYLPKPFASIDICFHELPPASVTNRNEILSILNSRTAYSE